MRPQRPTFRIMLRDLQGLRQLGEGQVLDEVRPGREQHGFRLARADEAGDGGSGVGHGSVLALAGLVEFISETAKHCRPRSTTPDPFRELV